jgi:hypothetical protein
MEHQIGISGEHGLEWQIVLTENEAVIVRRSTPVIMPANPPVVSVEPAPAQVSHSTTRSSTLAHPRIYANMR